MNCFSLSEPSPAQGLRWVVGTVPWRWLRWQWFGADHEDGTNMLAKTTECLVASKAKLSKFSVKLSISVGKVDFLGNVHSQNILNRLACGHSPFSLDMGFLPRRTAWSVRKPGAWHSSKTCHEWFVQKPRGRLPRTGKEMENCVGVFFGDKIQSGGKRRQDCCYC